MADTAGKPVLASTQRPTHRRPQISLLSRCSQEPSITSVRHHPESLRPPRPVRPHALYLIIINDQSHRTTQSSSGPDYSRCPPAFIESIPRTSSWPYRIFPARQGQCGRSAPEILFLRRDKPDASADSGRMSGSGPRTREAHVAFPGGKTEEGDEGGMYTGTFIMHESGLPCSNLH